jgi:hypothetical protein
MNACSATFFVKNSSTIFHENIGNGLVDGTRYRLTDECQQSALCWATLFPGKEPLIPSGYKAEWAPEIAKRIITAFAGS